MSWMIYQSSVRGDDVRTELEIAFAAAGWPSELALFSRPTHTLDEVIYLVPPAVAQAFPSIMTRRAWEPEPEPHAHGWDVILANGDAASRYGIRSRWDFGH